MTTMYHVAASWDGGDLLSLDEQINDGRITEEAAEASWKWDHAFATAEDRQYVSLWATLTAAQAWQAERGGQVLAVEIDTDSAAYITRVGEGHPAVLGRISADCVRGL